MYWGWSLEVPVLRPSPIIVLTCGTTVLGNLLNEQGTYLTGVPTPLESSALKGSVKEGCHQSGSEKSQKTPTKKLKGEYTG